MGAAGGAGLSFYHTNSAKVRSQLFLESAAASCQGCPEASAISSGSLVLLIRPREAAGSLHTSLGMLSFPDVSFVRQVDLSMHFNHSVRSVNKLYITMCAITRFSFAKLITAVLTPPPPPTSD